MGNSNSSKRRPHTVLILDDDFDVVEYISSVLDDRGDVETLIETDPWRALKMAKNFPIVCMFVDYRMPGLNGVEFYNAVSGIVSSPAVCFVTGDRSFDSSQLGDGKAEVLTKPFREKDLNHILDKYIEKSKVA